MQSTNDIRAAFLNYFAQQRHEVVPSASLVPENDPTLLFTNAGMVPFKEVFLGREKRPYQRATSSQRCVRAGGKHNDLENVGYTARHHTFFEMLGNFSFGDYFKTEAIHYAWEFLTGHAGLPAERLWVTVFQDDDEAADIWLNDIGIDPARFSRIGLKPGGKPYESDNFWSMGDTGPCGPCSEIFYDHGADIAGGPPGSPEEDGDRYIEIWNLVFMQYDRAGDGTLTPLPKPSVDTGMGLERLAAVLQGVHDNYDIDLFRGLIGAAADMLAVQDRADRSLRVIADHIRACAFLVADGVRPANEGRGYVLRRIIRRAVRHGYRLGADEPFFHRLVAPLCAAMGDAHPVIVQRQSAIEQILRQEEQRFALTLEQGLQILDRDLARLPSGTTVIPGETVFQLYDTYGFPADLTADIARERGMQLDMAGFEKAMEAQRQRARAASRFAAREPSVALDVASEFSGYDTLQDAGQVVALLRGGEQVASLAAGDEALVILDRTPFYAESGGQVGDAGELHIGTALFQVEDVRKVGQAIAHVGRLAEGELTLGETAEAAVAAERRAATARNHSATHLLHAALRRILGEQVVQKGSLVNAERLRFDFAHDAPVTVEQLYQIEALVNAQIRANDPVQTDVMAMDEAVASGAMALFGEKYGERVRVLRMGDFSVELCGGTHVGRTGDIGFFKLVSEGGVAAGVRRIEGVTGDAAVAWVQQADRLSRELTGLLQGTPEQLPQKVGQLQQRLREAEKALAQARAKLASGAGSDLSAEASVVGPAKVLAKVVEADPKQLRELADQLKNKLATAVVVLAAVNDGKVNIVAGITGDLTDRIRAGDLAGHVAAQVGGKGGGRADMAMAGGRDADALPAAIASVLPWVQERLGESS